MRSLAPATLPAEAASAAPWKKERRESRLICRFLGYLLYQPAAASSVLPFGFLPYAHHQSRHHRRRPETAQPAAANADRPRRRRKIRAGHPRRGGAQRGHRGHLRGGLAGRRGGLRPRRRQPRRPAALHPAARTARLRPRRFLRARFRSARAFPPHGGRPPLRERGRNELRPAPGGNRAGGGVRRLFRAGHARKPAAALRRRRRRAPARPPEPLPRGDGDRKADAHRGRAAPAGARPARRPLPLFLRHARAHAAGDGDSGAADCAASSGAVALSPALAELARREQYLALEESSRRYDVGARYGLLVAQLALALNGRDREDVLAQLVELLAVREMGRAAGQGPA